MDPQDRWGKVSSLCSLAQENQAPGMLSMDSESEDENGGEAGNKAGTDDTDNSPI